MEQDRVSQFFATQRPWSKHKVAYSRKKSEERIEAAAALYWASEKTKPLSVRHYNAIKRLVKSACRPEVTDDFTTVISERHADALYKLADCHQAGKEWANMLDMRLSSASKAQRMMNDLVNKGLILAQQEMSGRRHFFYQVTDKGHNIIALTR